MNRRINRIHGLWVIFYVKILIINVYLCKFYVNLML